MLSRVVESSSQYFSSARSQSSLSPSSTSSFNYEDQLLSSRYQPAPDFVKLKVPRKIANLPEVAAASDRHKLSPNAFSDVFAAIVRASGADFNNFVISTSTTNRAAKNVRTKMFEKAKQDFKKAIQHVFVSIHWDEKLLQKEVTLLQRNTLQFYHVIVAERNCWDLLL